MSSKLYPATPALSEAMKTIFDCAERLAIHNRAIGNGLVPTPAQTVSAASDASYLSEQIDHVAYALSAAQRRVEELQPLADMLILNGVREVDDSKPLLSQLRQILDLVITFRARIAAEAERDQLRAEVQTFLDAPLPSDDAYIHWIFDFKSRLRAALATPKQDDVTQYGPAIHDTDEVRRWRTAGLIPKQEEQGHG